MDRRMKGEKTMVQHQDKTEKQDRIMDIMDAMDPEEDSKEEDSYD